MKRILDIGLETGCSDDWLATGCTAGLVIHNLYNYAVMHAVVRNNGIK